MLFRSGRALAGAPTAVGSVAPGLYLSERTTAGARSIAQEKPVGAAKTTNLLSIQNLFTRNTGSSMKANRIKGLDVQQVDQLLPNGDLALAVKANLAVMSSADEQTEILEQRVIELVKLRPQFSFLKPCRGSGRSWR